MAYKLNITELAHEDLEGIMSYIAVELDNPVAAAHFLTEVEACYERLSVNPMIYEECRNHKLKREGYRKVSIGHYLLLYKIDRATDTVTVYRYFYESQDYVNKI